MIFIALKIDNLFSFKDVSLDLSIKRKLLNSTIPDEFLEGYENFSFKKVCIISGVNASGKTALGKLMLDTQHFILNKEAAPSSLREYICDKTMPGVIEVEFVLPQSKTLRLHRLKLTVFKDQSIPQIEYSEIPIRSDDTVHAVRRRLDAGDASNIVRIVTTPGKEIDALHTFRELVDGTMDHGYGWAYSISSVTSESLKIPIPSELLKKEILEAIVTTFDPSIIKVTENKDETGKTQAFSLIFNNGDSVVLDVEGNVTKPDRLSKGTYEALKVAVFLSRIINHKKICKDSVKNSSFVYYLDEAMAYVHTELEQLTLNLLIEHLPRHGQLFYTTHNYDVLDMNLPIHAHVFMTKNGAGTSIVQPETIVNKNDRSLVNYVRNDVFNTLPDMTKMEILL